MNLDPKKYLMPFNDRPVEIKGECATLEAVCFYKNFTTRDTDGDLWSKNVLLK